ncbi:ABC transporter permease [Larkinella soli]|uniref:ABC transporter permease n=1 Tax=Larkinella soli TaxID=1770527 RepID=UPI000FFC8ACC|nr:ABC transporter permease [Larkinella soli]
MKKDRDTGKAYPPRWPERLLDWFYPGDSIEEIQGDLQELFQKRLETVGPVQARREYVLTALSFLNPFRKARPFPEPSSTFFNGLFRNQMKMAVRTAWRNRTYTAINVFGLALGMSCCLLIGLYLLEETRYERFWPAGERIYRVNQTNHFEEERTAALVSAPVGPALARTVSGVEAVTRLFSRAGSMLFSGSAGSSRKLFQEEHVTFADSSFFRVFALPLLKGSPNRALAAPGSVVLSESAARRYFGSGNPMGRTLRFENRVDLTVTGVFADLPRASDFNYDFLVDFETLYRVEDPGVADFIRTNWLYNPTQTFARLSPGTDPARIEARMPGLLRQSADERVMKHVRLSLQPLHDLHLYSADMQGSGATGNIRYVRLLAIIAGITLLIACFNFINLSTAYSLRRAREVGVRKVLGAIRLQLGGQFLGEALFQCGVACLLALLMAFLLLPGLNHLAERAFGTEDLFRPGPLLLWLGLFGLTGLLSGAYPALFASGFRPIQSLRGTVHRGRQGGRRLRQGLVIAQFSLSLVLMTVAIGVYRQLDYLRSKPLGFQKEQVVVVPLFGSGGGTSISQGVDQAFRTRMNRFEQAVSGFSRIKGISAASGTPGSGFVRSLVVPEGRTEADNIFASWLSVDYDFLPTMNIPLAAGRNFSKQTGTDHLDAYLINESAVKAFGYPNAAAAVGRPIQRGGEGGQKGTIIGVVRDFHFDPLDQPIDALIIDLRVNRFTGFVVRIAPERMPETLAFLKREWEMLFPERVFEYSFLDEDLNRQYRVQEQLSRLLTSFSALALLISCLGLFGLAAYLTFSRTKEIGIRKVMGAGTVGLVTLLSRDFIRLVLIANLVAGPVSWLLLDRWLADYANRAPLTGWVFALAGAGTLLLAFLTVASQTLRAALSNPVDSLRDL